MNLFDLPLDVFPSIFEQIVVIVSYKKLARLRLVCSMYSVLGEQSTPVVDY